MKSQNSWKIYQIGGKSTFLNGNKEEEVYAKQPKGYVVKGNNDKFYKFKKALYGLKKMS